jgi:hypothetical protein
MISVVEAYHYSFACDNLKYKVLLPAGVAGLDWAVGSRISHRKRSLKLEGWRLHHHRTRPSHSTPAPLHQAGRSAEVPPPDLLQYLHVDTVGTQFGASGGACDSGQLV